MLRDENASNKITGVYLMWFFPTNPNLTNELKKFWGGS